MTLTRNQLGGGYAYQWKCAIWLALSYLVDDSESTGNSELAQLISNFLGDVQVIYLEGSQIEEDKVELEDINLLADDKAILIQVKTKEAEGKWWTPSDSLFLKSLYRFYKNPALDKDDPSVRFVFLSNRGFNSNLADLKRAIADGKVRESSEINHLFGQFQKEYDSPDFPLDQERFDRLIERLALIEFLSIDDVEDSIKDKLRALHIKEYQEAYETLYTKFSKRSIQGCRVQLQDLHKFLPQIFTGRLVDYVSILPHRSVARKIQALAKEVSVPILWNEYECLVGKIEAILQKERDALNAMEAFILTFAVCVRYLALRHNSSLEEVQVPLDENDLLGSNREHVDIESLDADQLRLIVKGLNSERYLTQKEVTIVNEVVPEVILVAQSYDSFDIEDAEYADQPFKDKGSWIRLRLLGALLYLANKINLDQYVNPDIAWEEMAPSDRDLWWRQAYVRSVVIEEQRLQLCFGIPEGYEEKYKPILVDPLHQEIARLIDLYDEFLKSAGLTLKILLPETINRDVSPIPDEEWQRFKRKVEADVARKAKDHLHNDIVRKQLLHRLLVQAEVSQAEQMVREDRHMEAAERYELVAKLLSEAKEPAQAKHYARQSAVEYLAAQDREKAAEQYIRAARIWLNNTSSPGIVREELKKAQELIQELTNPDLRVRLLLTQARLAFINFQDDEVIALLQQADDTISEVADKQHRVDLECTLVLERSLFAMVWEEWESAEKVLMRQWEALDGFSEQLFEILKRLLLISTELGNWETADLVHQQGLSLLSEESDVLHENVLNLHYAASLARRGDLEASYELYTTTIQALENNTENIYTLWLAYWNMEHILGKGLFLESLQYDNQRIDLFKKTQSDNFGYDHYLRANLALGREKYRDALQNLRLAQAYYWCEGDWGGIEDVYKSLAKLHFETKELFEALRASIRASDSKTADQYAMVVRDTGDKELLIKTVDELLKTRSVAGEQKVATKILGILADVISPSHLTPVLEQLFKLVQGPQSNVEERKIREYAVESLDSLVPQLDTEQTNAVVEMVLNEMQRKQSWIMYDKMFKLLESFFIQSNCRVDHHLYKSVVEVMLDFEGKDFLKNKVVRAMVHLARTAPPDVRERVIAHVQKYSKQSDRLSWLAFLGEAIPEDQLGSVIDQILNRINPKPHKSAGSTRIAFSGTNPRQINNFNEVLPSSLYNRVINGLLEAIINEHNNFHTRSGAVWSLSDLPTSVLAERVDEIADYLLWGSDGSLPRSPNVEWELESQTNPFSNFRMNTGNVEQIRRSSLRALGKLFHHFEAEIQNKVQDQFIVCSRDESSIVRQGVAIALDVIESNKRLSSRVLLALFVLLHDPDPSSCGWACRAAGHLIINGLASPFEDDFLDRVLDAVTEEEVQIRVDVAIALWRLMEKGNLDESTRNRVSASLEILANDVSFRVRREATREITSTCA